METLIEIIAELRIELKKSKLETQNAESVKSIFYEMYQRTKKELEAITSAEVATQEA